MSCPDFYTDPYLGKLAVYGEADGTVKIVQCDWTYPSSTSYTPGAGVSSFTHLTELENQIPDQGDEAAAVVIRIDNEYYLLVGNSTGDLDAYRRTESGFVHAPEACYGMKVGSRAIPVSFTSRFTSIAFGKPVVLVLSGDNQHRAYTFGTATTTLTVRSNSIDGSALEGDVNGYVFDVNGYATVTAPDNFSHDYALTLNIPDMDNFDSVQIGGDLPISHINLTFQNLNSSRSYEIYEDGELKETTGGGDAEYTYSTREVFGSIKTIGLATGEPDTAKAKFPLEILFWVLGIAALLVVGIGHRKRES